MRFKYSGKKALMAACTFCFVNSTGLAAPVEEFSLDQIIVTATRTPLEEKKVPQAVEVIDAAEIKKLGADNVTSALRLAKNINISKSGMTGNTVIMRGMSTNHVLILVDGRRMAGEDTSVTTNVYTLNRINVDSIERIEIVRGAASAMYGSDAMAGVINIITKQSLKPEATVGLSTGSEEVNNYYRFSSGKQGHWSTSLDARFTDVRDAKKYSYGVSSGSQQIVTDGYNSNMSGDKQYYNFDAIYDFENDNNNKLKFNFNYLKESLSSKYADGYMQASPSMFTSKDKNEQFNNDSYSFSAEYSGETIKNSYQIRTYYNKLKKESRLFNNRATFPGPMEGMLGDMFPKYDFDNAEYYMWVTEAHNTTKLDDNNILTYGGEYKKINYKGTRLGAGGDNVTTETINGIVKNSSEKSINSYAFYIQNESIIDKKLFIIPSVRFDHDSAFGSEVIPKLGITYAMDDNNRLKFNIGKGYKAPTISELYMHMKRAMGVAGTIEVIGNPDLQPEESTNFDISFEAERGKTSGKITYFQNRVTNLITTESLNPPTNTQNRYVNVDKAQINGVEVEGTHRLSDKFSIKVAYNWLDATDKADNSRLDNRARNNASLQLIYEDNKINPLSIILWNEWNYDYRYNNEDYDYSTTNFVVSKKINKHFNMYAGLDNIFNKKVDALYVDGRMWRLGAEYTF